MVMDMVTFAKKKKKWGEGAKFTPLQYAISLYIVYHRGAD